MFDIHLANKAGCNIPEHDIVEYDGMVWVGYMAAKYQYCLVSADTGMDAGAVTLYSEQFALVMPASQVSAWLPIFVALRCNSTSRYYFSFSLLSLSVFTLNVHKYLPAVYQTLGIIFIYLKSPCTVLVPVKSSHYCGYLSRKPERQVH